MRNFDILGKDAVLRYQGLSYNQTSIGGLLSIGILVVLILRCKYLFETINDQSQPQVLQYERLPITDSQFVINPQTFTLVVGITSDSTTYSEINSKIFQLESFITTKKTTVDSSTSKKIVSTQTSPVKLEKCTSKHFQIQDLTDLDSSIYTNQYCLPLDQELIIMGDQTGDNYTYLTIQLKKCTTDCEDIQTINDFMKANFVEVYFSDIYVNPRNGESPYAYYGKKLSFTNFVSQSKQTSIYLRNNRVETDVGLVGSDISTHIMPSFSYSEEHVFDYSADYVNSLVFKLEQKKENYYQISYQKFISVVCEIGGLLFILKLIIQPICSFYSMADMCINMVNKTFSFQEIKHQIKTSTEKEKTITTPNINNIGQNQGENYSEDKESMNKVPIISILGHIPKKESLRVNSIHENKVKSILKQKDHSSSNHSAESIHTPSDKVEELKQLFEQMKEFTQNKDYMEKKKSLLKSRDQRSKILDSIKSKQLKDKIRKTQIQISAVLNRNSNSFTFSFTEYIKSLFISSPKTKIIDQSLKQLNTNLDIQTIMNKLIEIDYLKKILLNEDQQTLFQFLPKPCMNYSVIDNEVVFHDSNLETKTSTEQYQDDYEKLKKGIESYKNIINQDSTKRTDNNLLKSLDPNYLSLFKELTDRKKSVTITDKFNIQPSILVHKSSQQNKEKKPKKLVQSPQTSPQEGPQQFLSINQQNQSLQLPEQILARQIEALQSTKRPSITTPQNSTVQLMIRNQENDFSNDFISSLEQDMNNNGNHLISQLEENIRFHSSSGIVQKPYKTTEHDNVFVKQQQQ